MQTKKKHTKEKSEAETEEGSTGESVLSSPCPAWAHNSSRVTQNRHRKLATTRDTDSTEARGSGAFGGGRNARRRLTTMSGAMFSSSCSPPPSPASSPPSSSGQRGFGLRGPLHCDIETEEIGLKDRLLRHRDGCSWTGRGNTQSGDPPVFANADALRESDDDEPSFVGRVGDTRGAVGKGVLFDSDDDESSSVGRVEGESRGESGKVRAGCDWRRVQRRFQHGRGRSSNVPSAHVSSHASVELFDKFRFMGARA